MPRIRSFEQHTLQYDRWFDDHKSVYESEIEAVRRLLPTTGVGMEIGVGTGRFAAPFGIAQGVEPSAAMRRIAEGRGVRAADGVAEALPYGAGAFDFVLMVTTICFVDDPQRAFGEASRVLRPGGKIVVGLVDRASPVGQAYEAKRQSSVFYRDARFFSVDEVVSLMKEAGFGDFAFCQTVFGSPQEIEEAQPVEDGYGRGSFVVIAGRKPHGRTGASVC